MRWFFNIFSWSNATKKECGFRATTTTTVSAIGSVVSGMPCLLDAPFSFVSLMMLPGFAWLFDSKLM